MPKKRTPEAQSLFELTADLTTELRAAFPEVRARASAIVGHQLDMHSFHGIIGGKNNWLVDAVRSQFMDPKEFFSHWLAGLHQRTIDAIEAQKHNPFASDNGAIQLLRLMQDGVVLAYTENFLKRNFYRNLRERMREKPHERLWGVWFGKTGNRFTGF